MEKTSFISGRALKTLLVIILIIGAGIGAYFIFRPKADLDAPYKVFYEYSTNEKINKRRFYQNFIKTVIKKKSLDRVFEEKISEEVTKNQITTVIERNDSLKTVISCAKKYDSVMLETFAFVENKDEKLANKQKELEKSYADLVEKTNTCYDHYITYIEKIDSLDYTPMMTLQKIEGFNTAYCDYAKSLTNFYLKVSKIFEGYVKDQFIVNNYSKTNFKVVTLWANGLVEKIVANSNGNFTAEKDSIANLKHFYDLNSVLESTYLSNKVELDKVLSNFDKADLQTCVSYLVNINYADQLSRIEDKDIKKAYEELGKNYFYVMAV